MTALTHDGLVETRQYNSRNQLTRITVAGQMDVEYRYFALTLRQPPRVKSFQAVTERRPVESRKR
jgi:hypothetical protein